MSNSTLLPPDIDKNALARIAAAAVPTIQDTANGYMELTAGTHVAASRPFYQHHGIYVGNGKVIAYLRTTGVTVCSWDEFADGNEVVAVIHSEEECFSPEQIVARAYSRVGESNYKIFTGNCEHFANWCVTGHEYSKQVQLLSLGAAAVVGGKIIIDLIKNRPANASLTAVAATAAVAILTNDKVQDTLAELADNVIEGVKPVYNSAKDSLDTVTDAIKDKVNSATNSVVETASQLVLGEEELSAKLAQMKHTTQESAEQAYANLSHLAQGVSDTLSSLKDVLKP